MNTTLERAPVMTILVVIIAVMIGIVGGILVIVEPDTLSFDQYIRAMTGLSIGAGLLGIGRGHAAAARVPVVPPPEVPLS